MRTDEAHRCRRRPLGSRFAQDYPALLQPQIEVVGTGANGDDAVSSTPSTHDIALLDIQMPGRDGLSAARESLSATAARVVFLTTFSDDEYIVSALKPAPAAT
ncbi:MAG: response regulator [Collinsella sp.]